MIDLSKIDGIYLFSGFTDLRKGINGYIGLASTIMDKKQMPHKLFIFCGRNKRSLKILEMDYDGWWLYTKKLVTGKFMWPKEIEGKKLIDKRQLSWLLDGLNCVQKTAHNQPLFDKT